MPKLWKRSNDWDVWLSAYLDGHLTPEEARQLQEHLARRPELRAQLDRLRRTVMALRDLPTLPVPRHFILSPAMAARSRPRPARRWSLALSWAAALAALMFVVVLAGDLWLLAPAGSQPTQAQEVVALAPNAQIETPTHAPPDELESSTDAATQAPPVAAMVGVSAEPPGAEVEMATPIEEGAPVAKVMVTEPTTAETLFASEATASVALDEEFSAAVQSPLETPTELPSSREPTPELATATELPGTSEPPPAPEPVAIGTPPVRQEPTEIVDSTGTVVQAQEVQSDRTWLRIVEVGLGLLGMVLFVAALIVRRAGYG